MNIKIERRVNYSKKKKKKKKKGKNFVFFFGDVSVFHLLEKVKLNPSITTHTPSLNYCNSISYINQYNDKMNSRFQKKNKIANC